MKVAVLRQDGFQIAERPVPTCERGEILVKTMACGVCEGDVFTYRTRRDAALSPIVLGHEGTGVVSAVGAGVQELSEGDVVTAMDGAYAEHFVTTPDHVVVLPQDMDPLYAMGEPIACCVHASHRFGIRDGDRVAMIGCGFMGLTCLQLARLLGAERICAIEPIDWRREVALQLGADAAYAPGDGLVESLLQEYGAFDVVIEATGVQGALDTGGDLVKQHGRLVLVGYHQSEGGMRTVNMKQWNFKAVDVVNGHVRRMDEKLEAMQESIDLMVAGRLRIEPLVTHYPLSHVQQAFDDLVGRKQGLFKAALVPQV